MTDLSNPIYSNNDAARKHLEGIRWANGAFCPHCGEAENIIRLAGKAGAEGRWNCRACQRKFTVTVGTLFERSHIPLPKWLLAVDLMAASKKGISAHQLHRMLGITYKSAWFMTHRIREAMQSGGVGLLGGNGGTVEVDETYWGNNGKQRKGVRGFDHKMKIVSLVERGGEKRSVVVDKVNAKTLRVVVEGNIAKDAHLMTDEFKAYVTVGKEYASHGTTAHSKGQYVDFSNPSIHSNTVESSFSLLKRGLIGTFHHVGEQHLQRYVTEFDFRWNSRKLKDAERAELLLSGIGGKRLAFLGTALDQPQPGRGAEELVAHPGPREAQIELGVVQRLVERGRAVIDGGHLEAGWHHRPGRVDDGRRQARGEVAAGEIQVGIEQREGAAFLGQFDGGQVGGIAHDFGDLGGHGAGLGGVVLDPHHDQGIPEACETQADAALGLRLLVLLLQRPLLLWKYRKA